MDQYTTFDRSEHPARVFATMDLAGKTYYVDALARELRSVSDPDESISFDGR